MGRKAMFGALLVLCLLASSATIAQATSRPKALPSHQSKRVCAKSTSSFVAACLSKVVTHAKSTRPLATTSYQYGYRPVDLQSAYKLPSSTAGAGQTIGIVDAYDDPSAAADLATYRSQFGLPPCTVANGCFRKVNQFGGTSYPAGDVGWAQETSLDLDMASAICPNCKILLVDGNSSSLTDLGTAENTAAALGANTVSNSYGTSDEFSAETSSQYAGYYNHPGVAITASSGDSGYNKIGYPAVLTSVTAVGGTALNRVSSARGWDEDAWSGAGSGCSAYVSKPAWQRDAGCARRTVADVSAVADPNTGVAVYDSYGSTGGANWYVFGGTSVSSPIIAGVYALAGNSATIVNSSYPYSHSGALFDAVGGSNGRCTKGQNTSTAYLCQAVTGYDGPTGLGTPNGTGGF